MESSKLIKKYFIGSKKTIFLNLLIFIFCGIFVTISNKSINKKKAAVSKLIIHDFSPFFLDSLNSKLYDLNINTYASGTHDDFKFRTLIISWNNKTLIMI